MLKALEYLPQHSMVAVDLGCGSGIEVGELLNRGYSVIAVDSSSAAIERVKKNFPLNPYLKVIQSSLEELNPWPKANLVFSYLVFPFCSPLNFERLIERAVESVKSEGVLAISVLGTRDEWVLENRASGISKESLLQKFDKFDVVSFVEEEKIAPAFQQERKSWHILEIIAKRIRE